MIFLRSLLYHIYFWTVAVVMNLAYTPALLGPRKVVTRGMELWGAVNFWGLKHIVGLDYEVRGRENIQKGPAIYAMKHMCMWETMAAQILLHDCALIMKKELSYIPWYGWYAIKTKQIIVDRGGLTKTMRSMLRSAKERVAEGRPIVIFPEGTRRNPGAPPDYKPGVAGMYGTLDVPCVPVALNSGLYWPRKGFIRRPGKIIVEFLPPIQRGLKRDAFMAELQTRIETATDRLLREGGWAPAIAKPALA